MYEIKTCDTEKKNQFFQKTRKGTYDKKKTPFFKKKKEEEVPVTRKNPANAEHPAALRFRETRQAVKRRPWVIQNEIFLDIEVRNSKRVKVYY